MSDGATSGILDHLAAVEDTVDGITKTGLIEALALFIERQGLESEFITWHHGYIDGTVEKRTQ